MGQRNKQTQSDPIQYVIGDDGKLKQLKIK